MALRKSLIIPGLLVASALPIGWALAQSGPPAPPDMGPGMRGPGMGHHGWRRMRDVTPETRERLLEGRIAGAKAALKLNDAQAKLWGPVEEQMRANFAARQKFADERRKEREARRAATPAQPPQGKQDQAQAPQPPAPSVAERIDRMSKAMSERADRMKAFSTAFKPFFDSLSDEQKAVAGVVLREMGGGERGRGHHHRWAMDFGHGPDRGPGMGPGMGPRQ